MTHSHSDLPGFQGMTTIGGILSDSWRTKCCKRCGCLLMKKDNLFRCGGIDLCPFSQGWTTLDFLTLSK
jgi:hypothetical protein